MIKQIELADPIATTHKELSVGWLVKLPEGTLVQRDCPVVGKGLRNTRRIDMLRSRYNKPHPWDTDDELTFAKRQYIPEPAKAREAAEKDGRLRYKVPPMTEAELLYWSHYE